MADATTAASRRTPGQQFAIVDSGSVSPNIKGLQFNTAAGRFPRGYLSGRATAGPARWPPSAA